MIRVEHLSKTYDKHAKGGFPALHDLSFELPDTGFICIVGPSGCGKTTLLNSLGALDVFEEGRISTDDLAELRCGSRLTEAERNRSFGYIFQNYYLLPEYSAAYNVYLGLHSLDLTHAEKMKRSLEALKAVDMERFARRAVGQLSGGQQQRVAIARALARKPRVIFADEPTGNLDEANTMNICALLRRISKTSLVVMVTHEERIANFFADRIITLSEGRLVSDNTEWKRGAMEAGGNTLYTGDFEDSTSAGEGITLRLLRQEGAAPVNLTVAVQRDRVILKVDDSRTVLCVKPNEPPEIREGERPLLELETVEQETVDMPWESAGQGKAGGGLGLSMLFGEARRLAKGKGAARLGSWLFLVVLTVLTLFSVADYLKVAALRPEDFITTDSHVLEVRFERGELLPAEIVTIQEPVTRYLERLNASGLKMDYITDIGAPYYENRQFLQMENVIQYLSGFSYVPLSRLDESALIYGRVPERVGEVVVDRWVLDRSLGQDGILQSGIMEASYFLGEKLHYQKKNLTLTIVGISDCGEPNIYLGREEIASLGAAGTEVIALSSLRELFPGEFDELTLAPGECIVFTGNAGAAYASRIGSTYPTSAKPSFTIVGVSEADVYAAMAVADEEVDRLIFNMSRTVARLRLYCEDKEAVKAFLTTEPEDGKGQLQVFVTDVHSEAWAAYRAATALRLGARQIVTFSVILLCMVMLYLLQRSRVQERVGMIAVYCLLGIPGRKLSVIFGLECVLMALVSTLPATALMWLGIRIVTALPSLDISLLLPWYAAGGVWLGILGFHLLSSLLPLWRLLRLPPARLAAQYDL